jgi:hypothetical protein
MSNTENTNFKTILNFFIKSIKDSTEGLYGSNYTINEDLLYDCFNDISVQFVNDSDPTNYKNIKLCYIIENIKNVTNFPTKKSKEPVKEDKKKEEHVINPIYHKKNKHFRINRVFKLNNTVKEINREINIDKEVSETISDSSSSISIKPPVLSSLTTNNSSEKQDINEEVKQLTEKESEKEPEIDSSEIFVKPISKTSDSKKSKKEFSLSDSTKRIIDKINNRKKVDLFYLPSEKENTKKKHKNKHKDTSELSDETTSFNCSTCKSSTT